MNKYLPIGTVLLLKGGKKKVMIIGYFPEGVQEGKKVSCDYLGCLFPEGVLDFEKGLAFNNEQIDKVYFLGFADDEYIAFFSEFNKLLQEKKDV